MSTCHSPCVEICTSLLSSPLSPSVISWSQRLSAKWRISQSLTSRSRLGLSQRRNFKVKANSESKEALKTLTNNDKGSSSGSEVDERILPYCHITKGAKKTLGEMEQEFLLALQAYYMGQEPIMSNEEFDVLKEELIWEGSKVVVLSPDEQRFMEAALSYQAGKPCLTDSEYDKLKQKLKQQNSKVAIEGPRCSLRSKKVYSDSSVDYLRMTLLNLPAALIALAVVFLFDDLSGFEITYLLELPEPYSFIFTWFVVLPFTFFVSRSLTDLAFKDSVILKGTCPNCGKENISYFGSILSIATEQTQNDVKCECGSTLKFCLETRLITLESLPPLTAAEKAAIRDA